MVEHPILQWERLWEPVEIQTDRSEQSSRKLLPDDERTERLRHDGFTPDIDSDWYAKTADIRRFSQLDEHYCLILLGSPGMGKSVWVNQQLDASSDWLPAGHRLHSLVNLGKPRITVEAEIVRSAEIADWRGSNEILHLYVDSLDEGLLRDEAALELIVDFLESLSTDERQRLRLRLISRNSNWSQVLSDSLKPLFTFVEESDDPSAEDDRKSSFGVFNLLPLRKKDVVAACREWKLSPPEPFFDHLDKLELENLAAVPVTLHMLLSLWKQGAPAESRLDAYDRGILRLCEEKNLARKLRVSARYTGTLTSHARKDIASYLAYRMVFSGKSSFALDTTSSVSDESMVHRQLATMLRFGRTEYNLHSTDALLEVLSDTGVFTPTGLGQYQFTQRYYSEYLAAYFLHNSGMEQSQRDSLLLGKLLGSPNVYPKYAEVAAWLASMDDDFFHLIAEHDPEVALLSDLASRSDGDRKALTRTYLDSIEFNRARPRRQFFSKLVLHKLQHSGIEKTLKPYITNRSLSPKTRDEALWAAREGLVVELAGTLADLALDNSQNTDLRRTATAILQSVGSTKVWRKLYPLLNDPDADIRRYTLQCLWPGELSCREMLHIISLPEVFGFEKLPDYLDESLWGDNAENKWDEYESFEHDSIVRPEFVGFIRHINEHFEDTSLPDILDWIAAFPEYYWPDTRMDDVIYRVSVSSVDNLGDPIVKEKYCKVLLRMGFRDNNLQYLFTRPQLYTARTEADRAETLEIPHAEQRRSLLCHVVEHGQDHYIWPHNITHSPLYVSDDYDFVFKQLTSEWKEEVLALWVKLAWQVYRERFDPTEQDIVAFLYELGGGPIWDEYAQHYIGPWSIDDSDPNTHQRKEYYRREIEREQRRSELEVERASEYSVEDVRAAVDQHLAVCHAEGVKRWTHSVEVFFNGIWLNNDRHNLAGFRQMLDIRAGEAWQDATDNQKDTILDLALKSVLDLDPTNEVFSHQLSDYSDRSTVISLALIHLEQPKELELHPEVWYKWAGAIAAFDSSLDYQELHKKMLAKAFEANPNAVNQTISNLFRGQPELVDNKELLEHYVEIAGVSGAGLLVELLDVVESQPGLRTLFRLLFEADETKARECAVAAISGPLPADKDRLVKPVEAAIQWLASDHGRNSWRVIKPKLSTRKTFAAKFYLRFAGRRWDTARIRLGDLPVEIVAELYRLIEKRHPSELDKKHSPTGTGKVRVGTTFHDVRSLQSDLLHTLELRASSDSIDALERLSSLFPQQEGLRRLILDARIKQMAGELVTPSTDDLNQLLENRTHRLIRTSNQLLDVVVELLAEYQCGLSEFNTVRSFWNTPARSESTPRDENEMSDLVGRWLNDLLRPRGISVTREPERKRLYSSGRGQSMDMFLDAPFSGHRHDDPKPYSLVIEAKGCWHSDVMTSMKSQLVGQYMKDSRIRAGVYLVFHSSHPALPGCKRRSLEHLRTSLETQAAELSQTGYEVRSMVLDISLPQS